MTRLDRHLRSPLSPLPQLWAWDLTEYDRVVHLDMDSLVLRPLTAALFDHGGVAGMATPGALACVLCAVLLVRPSAADATSPVGRWCGETKADLLLLLLILRRYTFDYNMAGSGARAPPIQGGFLALTPARAVFDDLLEVCRGRGVEVSSCDQSYCRDSHLTTTATRAAPRDCEGRRSSIAIVVVVVEPSLPAVRRRRLARLGGTHVVSLLP